MRCSLVLALVAALGACSKEAPPPAPPPAAVQPTVSAAAVDGPASLDEGLRGAAEIEAKRPALRKVEGKLAMEGASTKFEAYFEGTVLRQVEEEAGHGASENEREYYLDSSGVLFYYHAQDERTVTQPGKSGKESVSIRVVFDPAGNVRASEKTLNGQPAPLLETDVSGAMARLGALRQAAAQAQ